MPNHKFSTTAAGLTLLYASVSASTSQQLDTRTTLFPLQCLKQPPLPSCPTPSNPTTNTCCTETRGGLVLATQFWTTYTGLEESDAQYLPASTWGIHGLWPDFCNGSYTQYCDLSRQYDPEPSPNTTDGTPNGVPVPPYTGPDIGTFIAKKGRWDLLAYMKTYWISRYEKNEILWAHEFSKHATCFSTFDIACYGKLYRAYDDVMDYFETAIQYNRRFPTFKWLADEGIVPSNSTRYSLSDIQGTLAKRSGSVPYVGCARPRFNETEAGRGSLDNGNTVVSEVWYYQHVYGRPQEGRTVAVDATGSNSNCARTVGAVLYPERAEGSERRPLVPF